MTKHDNHDGNDADQHEPEPGHSHEAATDASTKRPHIPEQGRALAASRIVVLVLAIVTTILLIQLWPQGDLDIERPGQGLDTERAVVTGTSIGPCGPIEGAGDCVIASVRLETGPDEGRTYDLTAGPVGEESTLNEGDVIRVVASQVPESDDFAGIEIPEYSIADFERRLPLLLLTIAFASFVIALGRWRGVRSLIGLGLSLILVVTFIVPAMLEGSPPLLVALAGAFAVMLITLTLTHGVGPKTMAAAIGTALSLLITVTLAQLMVNAARLTGFSNEEATYLIAYVENLSLQGLLLAGMVIAALGVLDDVTVSQASTVMALRAANPMLTFPSLVQRGLEVGRDHIAATVNTLFLAYAGASLPVLLVFAVGDTALGNAINSEAVAAELVATLVGSIGLLAAMPITTVLAAFLAVRMTPTELDDMDVHVH